MKEAHPLVGEEEFLDGHAQRLTLLKGENEKTSKDEPNSQGTLKNREGFYSEKYAQSATKLGLLSFFAIDLFDGPCRDLLTKKQKRRLRKLLAAVENLKATNRAHQKELQED